MTERFADLVAALGSAPASEEAEALAQRAWSEGAESRSLVDVLVANAVSSTRREPQPVLPRLRTVGGPIPTVAVAAVAALVAGFGFWSALSQPLWALVPLLPFPICLTLIYRARREVLRRVRLPLERRMLETANQLRRTGLSAELSLQIAAFVMRGERLAAIYGAEDLEQTIVLRAVWAQGDSARIGVQQGVVGSLYVLVLWVVVSVWTLYVSSVIDGLGEMFS